MHGVYDAVKVKFNLGYTQFIVLKDLLNIYKNLKF